MLDPFAAVVIYDENNGDAGYLCVAHNLSSWDAIRLAQRLDKQYELDVHVVLHRVEHEAGKKAPECEACMMLFEEIIERASKGSVATVSDATGNSDG